jgi:hypothetical protein
MHGEEAYLHTGGMEMVMSEAAESPMRRAITSSPTAAQ